MLNDNNMLIKFKFIVGEEFSKSQITANFKLIEYKLTEGKSMTA